MRLVVDSLSVGYRNGGTEVRLIHDVSFALAEGACLGVIGGSGAGKSVTACAIGGILPPPLRILGGRVIFDGVPLVEHADWRAQRGSGLLVLLQSPLAALDPMAPVDRQVADAVSAAGRVSRRAARARARQALARAGITGGIGQARPHHLSGGMRQRVLLAFAWALAPRVLIADEPTSGLDPVRQLEVIDLLREIVDERATSLVVTSHDLRVIAQLARQVLVLDRGRVIEQTTLADLLSAPATAVGQDMAQAFRRLHEAHGG